MTASRLFARAVTAYLRQHLPGWRLANAAPQVVAQQDGERMRIVFGFHIVRDEKRD